MSKSSKRKITDKAAKQVPDALQAEHLAYARYRAFERKSWVPSTPPPKFFLRHRLALQAAWDRFPDPKPEIKPIPFGDALGPHIEGIAILHPFTRPIEAPDITNPLFNIIFEAAVSDHPRMTALWTMKAYGNGPGLNTDISALVAETKWANPPEPDWAVKAVERLSCAIEEMDDLMRAAIAKRMNAKEFTDMTINLLWLFDGIRSRFPLKVEEEISIHAVITQLVDMLIFAAARDIRLSVGKERLAGIAARLSFGRALPRVTVPADTYDKPLAYPLDPALSALPIDTQGDLVHFLFAVTRQDVTDVCVAFWLQMLVVVQPSSVMHCLGALRHQSERMQAEAFDEKLDEVIEREEGSMTMWLEMYEPDSALSQLHLLLRLPLVLKSPCWIAVNGVTKHKANVGPWNDNMPQLPTCILLMGCGSIGVISQATDNEDLAHMDVLVDVEIMIVERRGSKVDIDFCFSPDDQRRYEIKSEWSRLEEGLKLSKIDYEVMEFDEVQWGHGSCSSYGVIC